MGKDIDLTMSGGVQKPKKANCERRVKCVCYIFDISLIDIPETQPTAGISPVSKEAKCRQ